MSTDAVMPAAYIDAVGSPQAIRYGELPRPRPGPGEVLIMVEAVAVNSVDTFIRSGRFVTEMSFPFVIGRDLAGTVVGLGDGVDGFAVGDRVWCNSLGYGGRQGAASQYVVAARERTYPAPPGVEPTTMASLVHPAATAYLATHVHAELRAGQSIFVGGAAGHVGSAIVVLAHRLGARVIASAAADDHDRVRSLGADAVVDYHADDHDDQVHFHAPDGVDVAVDTSGRRALDATVGLLAQGGRMVVLAGLGGAAELTLGALYTQDRSIHGFAITNATLDQLRAAAALITPMIADGSLAPRAITVLPLRDAAAAHRMLEEGHRNRIVLVPDPGRTSERR